MTHKDPLIKDLTARRQALGWSLQDVSERCGIDERFIGDWERGVGSPRLDAAQRWSSALGIKFALVPAEDQVRHGLRIDWQRRSVTVDGTPVRLTPMEWKGLERLAWAPGELVTHQALFSHLYGDERPYSAQSTAVRVLITKLRRLLPLRIEARWGQGYMVTGIETSRPQPRLASNDHADMEAVEPAPQAMAMPEPRESLHLAFAAESTQRPPPAHREVLDLATPVIRRVAAATPRPERRTDELNVIERFLAERGVTRCPDAAAIQQAPLPTLVWDKLKRKWVRPAAARPEAG